MPGSFDEIPEKTEGTDVFIGTGACRALRAGIDRINKKPAPRIERACFFPCGF